MTTPNNKFDTTEIISIENDERTQDLIAINLSFCGLGHTLVQIRSREEALAIAREIAHGERNILAILLDGNLEPDSKDGQDARDIIDEMGKAKGSVPIIAIAGEHFDDKDHPIYLYLGKEGLAELPTVIDELDARQMAS